MNLAFTDGKKELLTTLLIAEQRQPCLKIEKNSRI